MFRRTASDEIKNLYPARKRNIKVLCSLLVFRATMTNRDDNFALLSPCMFGKGTSYDGISPTPKGPESFSWCYSNTDKSCGKTKNIMLWSPALALTSESSGHSSTLEPCAWKSSDFHERESETDDVDTKYCCENVQVGSEGISVTCWNSGLLLDDGNSKGQGVEGSSPWSEGLPTTESAFTDNSNSRSTRSRESSRMKKTRVTTGSYKHIPHRDKPPQLVARRNARERRRVQAVNSAFSRLRKVVPMDSNR